MKKKKQTKTTVAKIIQFTPRKYYSSTSVSYLIDDSDEFSYTRTPKKGNDDIL